MQDDPKTYIAFHGERRLAAGSLETVALAAWAAGDLGAVLIFDAETARPVEIDLRGGQEAVRARLEAMDQAAAKPAPRGPGRPKLGVVAREVTLLPRHWDWLAAQPGGASVTLRKLVEEARRGGAEGERVRLSREAAFRFMGAMAGNQPGYEEATRALFAGDGPKFRDQTEAWPADIRDHTRQLAGPGLGSGG